MLCDHSLFVFQQLKFFPCIDSICSLMFQAKIWTSHARHDIITLWCDVVSAASGQRMTDLGALDAFLSGEVLGNLLWLTAAALCATLSVCIIMTAPFLLTLSLQMGTWSAWLLKTPMIKHNKGRELFSVPSPVLHGCFCLLACWIYLSSTVIWLTLTYHSPQGHFFQNRCGWGLWVVRFSCSVCGVGYPDSSASWCWAGAVATNVYC